MEQAKAEGWGAEGATSGEQAHNAAEADFQRLRAWCNDGWYYVGVTLSVSRKGVTLTDDYAHALWGIESDSGAYLTEVANELLNDALEAAREKLKSLCGC